MSRKLPLYAEKAFGELQATRGYVATEFEQKFRAEFAVSCKAGCANCCSHPLLISIAEAILLHRFLAGRGRLTAGLRARLKEHGELTAFMDSGVWMRANIPCPLLDDRKRCLGYEARPLACRLKFSAGDPDKCHPHQYNPEDMASVREMAPIVAAFEERLLKAHGVSSIRMPVSRALILAGRVLGGEIDLNTIDRVLYGEFLST